MYLLSIFMDFTSNILLEWKEKQKLKSMSMRISKGFGFVWGWMSYL